MGFICLIDEIKFMLTSPEMALQDEPCPEVLSHSALPCTCMWGRKALGLRVLNKCLKYMKFYARWALGWPCKMRLHPFWPISIWILRSKIRFFISFQCNPILDCNPNDPPPEADTVVQIPSDQSIYRLHSWLFDYMNLWPKVSR